VKNLKTNSSYIQGLDLYTHFIQVLKHFEPQSLLKVTFREIGPGFHHVPFVLIKYKTDTSGKRTKLDFN